MAVRSGRKVTHVRGGGSVRHFVTEKFTAGGRQHGHPFEMSPMSFGQDFRLPLCIRKLAEEFLRQKEERPREAAFASVHRMIVRPA